LEYYDTREYDLAGRISKLKTIHGVIETPYLFPVIDPIRQDVEIGKLAEIGFNAFITNAYLYYKRNNGLSINIHDYFKWDKPIMTDSGGYQILVYGSVDVDNATIVSYEKSIGVDIGVILDIPTGTRHDLNEAWRSVRETIRRAWEALPLIMDSKQLWVLPIQGLPYIEPFNYSVKVSSRIPYHIYALGSPTVYLEKYLYEDIVEYTLYARIHLPVNKPIHVFGVGHPMIIPFLVAVGAELFDSASYILYARDDRLMFEWGTRRLDELQYLPCNCPVCSRIDVNDLREMNRNERVKYIALHNLYVLKGELNRVKEAINEGRLWEYLEYKSRMHPSLRRVFNILIKYREYLKQYNPYSKTPLQALLILDRYSYYNPRLEAIRENTHRLLTMKFRKSRILLLPAINKPFQQQELYLKYKDTRVDYNILFYHPYLGIFPPQLSNTYPYFQHEIGEYELSEQAVKELVEIITNLEPLEVLILKPGVNIYDVIAEEMYRELKHRGYRVDVIHA